MARIAGVNIPTNKRVVIALQYIHGIGQAKAKEIVQKVGIEDARRVNQLSDAEVLAGPYCCAPTRAGLVVRFTNWSTGPADASLH